MRKCFLIYISENIFIHISLTGQAGTRQVVHWIEEQIVWMAKEDTEEGPSLPKRKE
jgi:hypothetical protein